MSTRFLVRLGFCAVFVLLVASLYESYRILGDKINDPTAGQEPYKQVGRQLGRLRRVLSASGTLVREFLLNPRLDRVEIFSVEVHNLEVETEDALGQLQQNPPYKLHAEQLRLRMRNYFAVLTRVDTWSEERRFREGYSFLREQLPARTNAVTEILSDLSEANESESKRVAEEFTWSRQAAMRRIFFLPAVCMVIAVAVVGFSFAYARDLEVESQRKYEEIALAKNEMERLSARLLNVQEEERRRLSRELHDGIGQTLTALRIEISHFHAHRAMADEDSRERWARARRLAEDAVRTVRDISKLLRPSLLDDLGLEPALRWQAEEFTRRTGISCHFTASGLTEHMPDAWKTCVFRIVQEAIHNCEKHAAPSNVRVNIRHAGERLTVEVDDDGRGFEMASKSSPASSGLGIVGMRERAAMLGGTLQIQSAPGRGTKLTVSLPLAQSAVSDTPRALPSSVSEEIEA